MVDIAGAAGRVPRCSKYGCVLLTHIISLFWVSCWGHVLSNFGMRHIFEDVRGILTLVFSLEYGFEEFPNNNR